MPTIIYPPTLPWNWMVQRPQQLMKELSFLGYTILYEDIGSFPQPQTIPLWESFYLCQGVPPLSIPHTRPRILWLTFPHHVNLIERYQPDYVIFDCSDEPKEEFSHWMRYWKAILSKANIVFASSSSLFEQLSAQHENVALVRNGVDYSHFATPQSKPLDLPKDKSLVGYSGAIAPWLDWNLLKEVILNQPELHFIFLGALVKLKQFPIRATNLSYLGLKSYSILPAYLQHFDVGIIPFRITEMTKGCNPIKLYEYSASGLPIVATPLPELCQINCPNLRIAANPIEFSSCLSNIPNKARRPNPEVMKSFALENSWLKRAQKIHSIILNTT